jgi:hypothetical protein
MDTALATAIALALAIAIDVAVALALALALAIAMAVAGGLAAALDIGMCLTVPQCASVGVYFGRYWCDGQTADALSGAARGSKHA